MADQVSASGRSSEGGRLPPFAKAAEFYSCLGHSLRLAFRPEEPGIYLLGSHVTGRAVTTSDLDLAVVFGKPLDAEMRAKVVQAVAALQSSTPILLDVVVVDERELRQGLTPNLVRTRLLTGSDLLAGRPLRTPAAMSLYYTGLAMVFIHLIREAPSKGLPIPLAPPDQRDPHLGYTHTGTRVGKDRYRSGLNLLLKLVVAIASFRLVFLKGIITFDRQDVVTRYGDALASDPWWPLVRDVYELARGELAGEMPTNEDEQAKLAACCRQVTAFENAFLVDAMTQIPALLLSADAAFVAQVAAWAAGTRCSAPEYQERLEAIKVALNSRNAAPPVKS